MLMAVIVAEVVAVVSDDGETAVPTGDNSMTADVETVPVYGVAGQEVLMVAVPLVCVVGDA